VLKQLHDAVRGAVGDGLDVFGIEHSAKLAKSANLGKGG
jgi:hypothetical protein